MLPNLIIPGFPRTGTTWVYTLLKSHPDFFLPTRKEIHYFDRNYGKGLKWYERQFAAASDQMWVADITPDYIQHADIADRLYAVVPDAKILIIVRDPVDRLYSEYQLYDRTRNLETTFENKSRDPAFYGKSYYAPKVQTYLERFGESNVLVLVYEDSLVNPTAYIQRVFGFLGLSSSEVQRLPSGLLQRRINSTVEVRSAELHRMLHAVQRFGRHLHNDPLDRALNLARDVYYKFFLVKRKETVVPPPLRARLLDLYSSDMEELSMLLGRDLAADWRHDTRSLRQRE